MYPSVHLPIEAAPFVGLVVGALLVACAALVLRLRSTLKSVTLLFVAYLAGSVALAAIFLRVLDRSAEVSGYALALGTGVLVAWSILPGRLRKVGLSHQRIFAVLFGCLVLGLAGGRIVDALGNATFGRALERGGGASVFGAFGVGAVWLGWVFRRDRADTLWRALDAGSSAIWLNLAFGRLGCLLSGCCFGAPTSDGPFAISRASFELGTPASSHGDRNDMIWATQPIEIALVLALALTSELLYRRRLSLRPGVGAACTAAMYGLGRGLLEAVRDDSPHKLLGTFTIWQVASLLLVLGACGVLLRPTPRGELART